MTAADIVRSTDWLMDVLEAVRQVDPPDWWIGAGAVRTAVWDRLHGYEQPTPLADLDLICFDPDDLSEEREHEIEETFGVARPGTPWDVKNQAAVHLWFPKKFGTSVEPFDSSAAAVATWPETATCVAVRLDPDDQLRIHAPLGLDDLFAMVHRRNPARVTVEEYERRLVSKRIAEKWPRARIVPAEPARPSNVAVDRPCGHGLGAVIDPAATRSRRTGGAASHPVED